MTVRKLSVSLSPELAEVLDSLCRRRDEDRSRLVETLLREHGLVQGAIKEKRGPVPSVPQQWEAVGRRKRLRMD